MSKLTKEDRMLIVRGMLRKTTLKKRFAAEQKRLGAVVMAAHKKWVAQKYGQALADYIERMKPEYRQLLCKSHDEFCFNWRYFGAFKEPPEIARLTDDRDGYEDRRYYLELNYGGHIKVALPKPVWKPKDHHDFKPAHWPELGPELEGLEALARELNEAVDALHGFLSTVTTVDKLKAMMPEAVEFLPAKAHPIAVIPNPGNAMAALARAGFPDGEQDAREGDAK